jgi:sec-independent protein translocase protein TatA
MMVNFWQVLIVLLVIVLLFGRGKISEVMGDVAKGIKSFKKGLTEEDEQPKAAQPEKQIDMSSEKAEDLSREERKIS